MLQIFNQTFNLEGPFKRAELEDALVKEFGTLHYHYFDGGKDYEDALSVGVKNVWGQCTFEINSPEPYNNIDSALMKFFIEMCKDKDFSMKNVDRFYMDEREPEVFKQIISKVYGKEL